MTLITEYFGKFYLVPESKWKRDTSTVFLNFGWNSVGNQSFPVYSETILADVCTEIQYKNMIDEIKKYLDDNGMDYCCASTLCIFGWCLCIPLCYLMCRVNQINRDLREIIEKNSKKWSNCSVVMEMTQSSGVVNNLSTGVGYLEDGTVLTRPEMVSRGSDMVPSGRQEAIWPPLGYNIIINIKGTEIRTNWPKLRIGQIPVKSPVIDREISLSEELQKLMDLKDRGAITADEYTQAKAKVLNIPVASHVPEDIPIANIIM